MSKTKHGKSWISRHINDPFVQKAQIAGYRSRSSFKLLELHEKDRLFRQNMFVIDLGAAPGGWSQVVAPLIGRKGKIIALDRLSMDPIPGVQIIEGDFLVEATLIQLQEAVGREKVDWVISDLSPNLSGMKAVDQPCIMELAELAWDFAKAHLKPTGGLVVKIFQGEGFDHFIKRLRTDFEQVLIRKPKASRPESKEQYVIARARRP